MKVRSNLDVAGRLLAMLSCVYFSAPDDESSDSWFAQQNELLAWMSSEGLFQYMSAEEIRYVRRSADEQPARDFSWLEEGVGVLAWILNLDESILDYSRQVELDGEAIFNKFHFLSSGALVKLAEHPVQMPEKIRHGFDFYYAIRHRAFNLHDNFSKSSMACADYSPFQLRVVGGDLDVGGLKFDSLSVDFKDEIKSISIERFRAFGWYFFDMVDAGF